MADHRSLTPYRHVDSHCKVFDAVGRFIDVNGRHGPWYKPSGWLFDTKARKWRYFHTKMYYSVSIFKYNKSQEFEGVRTFRVSLDNKCRVKNKSPEENDVVLNNKDCVEKESRPHCGIPEDNCSICIDKMKSPFIRRCGHKFCKDCIFKWYEKSNTYSCPLCRKS